MKNESIVSTFEAFKEKFPKLVEIQKDSRRMQCLKRYFNQHMVISLGSIPKGDEWPEIVYPTKMKLKKDIERLEKSRAEVSKRHNEWKGTLNRAKLEGVTTQVKKFAEPAYWKHLGKMVSDADYRADANAIQLPVHLVGHKRYKPMVEMFVNNLDYRKQLTETVTNSVVYKDNKKLGRYAEELTKLRTVQSQKTVDQTKQDINVINEDIDMYKELMNWAKK